MSISGEKHLPSQSDRPMLAWAKTAWKWFDEYFPLATAPVVSTSGMAVSLVFADVAYNSHRPVEAGISALFMLGQAYLTYDNAKTVRESWKSVTAGQEYRLAPLSRLPGFYEIVGRLAVPALLAVMNFAIVAPASVALPVPEPARAGTITPR